MMTVSTAGASQAPNENSRQEALRQVAAFLGRDTGLALEGGAMAPLGPGEVAELRRLRPGELGGSAFWRVAMGVLEPARLISLGARREEEAALWVVILGLMATMRGLHQPGRRLGVGLAKAGFSEQRFSALLRAEGGALHDQLRRAVRFLGAKGEAIDLVDLAELVLSDGAKNHNTPRRAQARAFYSNQKS